MPVNIRLENNLILRSLRDENDRQRYAKFNEMYGNPFEGDTCACLLHHHPETTLEDYWLVEDQSTGEIVSTTCLLPWECYFSGVKLRVAQLEMVLTHPAYRHRGLIREQIKLFKQTVQERGYDLTIICGIPYYYRQYGYAYAIDMEHRESLPVWKIPEHASVEDQEIRLRPASLVDVPKLVEGYTSSTSGLDFFTRRNRSYWVYLLESAKFPIEMVEVAQTGEPIGYAVLVRSKERVTVLESGLPGNATAMAFLRCLKQQVSQQVVVCGSPYTSLVQFTHSLGSQVVESGQWLLRFPDIPRFLKRIKPVIEKRLAGSPWRDLTAELVINLYRQGYCLRFSEGRLAGVDALGFIDASMGADGGHLCIPPDAFVRLVTGYRRLDELSDAWPDIVVKPEVRNLIENLFPPVRSYLYMPYHFMGSRDQGM